MSEQNVLPKVTIYQQYAGYADIAKGYAPTDDVADAVDDEVVHPVQILRSGPDQRCACQSRQACECRVRLGHPACR
jgi:hypothetical protein